MTRSVCGMVAAAFAASMTLALALRVDRPSFAQQAKGCAPTEINLGGKGHVYGYNGRASFEVLACAAGDVLISQGEGLPALQRLTNNYPGQGFLDVFEFRPCELPLGSDLPGAPVTISFVSGNKAANATRTFTLDPDNEKPTLTTTSEPDKGSKVRPKQKIVVRMHADERYGAARFGWQGGVKKILLRDESRNQDVAPQWDAPGGPAPCNRKQWEQRLQVTYVVPDDPPPIIRLRACAWDHANNQDCDVAEFPTGEIWAGTIRLIKDQRNPACSAIKSEASYTIVVRGDGDVSGSGTFNHSGYTCEGGFTAPATKGTIELVGKKTGSTLTVYVNDWEPKNGFTPRLPGGQQIVQIADGTAAEGTFTPGIPEVVFSVRLECRTCGKP